MQKQIVNINGKDIDIVYNGRWIYNWFSNFEPIPIIIDGVKWPSVENYYQSQKTTDEKLQKQFLTCTPSVSKKLGRSVPLRSDWESIKLEVMEKALRAKFNHQTPDGIKLMTTEGELVEWNNWGDKVWGKTLDGQGDNLLGKMLMSIREEMLNHELFD